MRFQVKQGHFGEHGWVNITFWQYAFLWFKGGIELDSYNLRILKNK